MPGSFGIGVSKISSTDFLEIDANFEIKTALGKDSYRIAQSANDLVEKEEVLIFTSMENGASSSVGRSNSNRAIEREQAEHAREAARQAREQERQQPGV